MNSAFVQAFAKVNLTLEVLGTRADGFHELKSVVQPISLADDLALEATDDGLVASDTGYGEKDLIVRAAKALRFAAGAVFATRGARVRVTKRIPAGGGLGGGSADAAATLRALNELWGCGLPPAVLAEVGAEIGSDIPALVLAQHYRVPVLMEGRGERVRLLAPVLAPGAALVLAFPDVFSSTAEVYARCVPRDATAQTTVLNDLEAPACALHPEIAAALDALRAAGADAVRMSGSGSTVFGLAADATSAQEIVKRLAAGGLSACVATTI